MVSLLLLSCIKPSRPRVREEQDEQHHERSQQKPFGNDPRRQTVTNKEGGKLSKLKDVMLDFDPTVVPERSYYVDLYGHYGYMPFWGPGYTYPGYPYYPF